MRLASNIAANALSRLWLALVQIAVTPMIVHLLGPTSYGLVGFYTTLLLTFWFLDQCASPVLSRSLAQLGTASASASEARDLLRTMEIVSWSIGFCIGAAVVAGAPLIARHWIGGGLPENQLVTALRLMGLGIAAQWPAFLYGSGFVGLQRQDLLQATRVILMTLQAAGAVLVLKISATPERYLLWQAVTNAGISLALGLLLWRTMPPAEGVARVSLGLLQRVWRFAAGNFTIGFLGAILTQMGGLIVAKYCSLQQFAAYALATTLVSQISTILTQPISAALMPHFVQVLAASDARGLADEYHRWAQRITMLVLPVTATLFVFTRPLMDIWLGSDSPLAAPVAGLLPWLAVGTLFNTLVTPAYLLQIADGWTRLTVVTNIVAVGLAAPFLIVSVPAYGPIAAVACWAALNVGYYLFSVPQMHKRLLPGELWTWWTRDTGLPMLVIGCLYLGIALIGVPVASSWWSLAYAILAASGAAALLALVLPHVRADACSLLQRFGKAAPR
jgi:O-antigen/teichoic acid export membrane protein